MISVPTNTVIFQRKIGKHVRCAEFSPNKKYLAFGMDGFIAIYQVDSEGMSPEPLRLLSRRQFTNTNASQTFTQLEWSFDSRLLSVASNSHIQRIYTPLRKLARFNLLSIPERSEIIGCFFKGEGNYDVSENIFCFQCLRVKERRYSR